MNSSTTVPFAVRNISYHDGFMHFTNSHLWGPKAVSIYSSGGKIIVVTLLCSSGVVDGHIT